MNTSGFWQRLLATTVISGAGLLATPAFAQAVPAGEEPEQPTQESTLGGDDPTAAGDDTGSAGTTITVTGSRIARPDLSSVSPVTIVDSEQVQLTGTTTLETLINDLPSVIPGNNRTSNNAGGFPFSTLDLRGLGPGRTLILVDGERLPASTSSGVVDIAQVPVGLISRVDVVTGGATAVYGSDAIAGVVNFILRQDFEGLELTGQTGIAEEGVGFNYNVSAMFGGNFAEDRGNIVVYGSFFEREGVSQGRFDYSRTSAAVCDSASTGLLFVCDDPSDLAAGDSVFFSGGSATPPWGQVVNNAGNAFNHALLATTFPAQFGAGTTPAGCTGSNNLSFNDAGALTRYFNGGVCAIPIRANGSSRYSFNSDNLLSIPYDRLNLSVLGRYEFTDNTRVRIFAAYTNSNSEVNLAPTPAAGGTGFVIDPVRVAASCVGAQAACALPADLAFALSTRPNPNATFSYDRRFSETGPRIGLTESQSFNGRFTLEHDIDANWKVSGGLGFGRSDLNSINIGNINRVAVEQGIYGCRVTPTSAPGGPGIIPGCVPVDIYGANTITPAQVAFIQTDTTDVASFEQQRASVNLTGSLFDLPGGPVGLAVGAEIRKDSGETVPDDAKQRGEIIGFNQQQAVRGAITAKEVYGEARFPLLGGGGGFPDMLAVELGGRYSDYDSLQDPLFNYKAALEFAPINWLRFRGAYNKAARAPSVFELFQAGDQGFPSFTDPCNFNRPGGPAAACTTGANGAPTIPAANAATFLQNNSQVQAFSFGQPDLEEEKAETWTVGAVFAPRVFPIGRFSATVDYYDITLRGSIQSLGATFYISQCYISGNPSACERIVRDPATGQIDRVNTGRRNSPDEGGPTELRGIDASVNWAIPLADVFGGGSRARVRLSNLFSYAMDYKVGGTDFVDIASGGIGGVTSKYSNTATFAVDNGPFTGQLRWVYKSGGEDDTFGLDDDGNGFSARVPDLSFFDLSLRMNAGDRFTITGIVNNLFNKYPKQTVSGALVEQANINASFFSPLILGRSYSVQVQTRF